MKYHNHVFHVFFVAAILVLGAVLIAPAHALASPGKVTVIRISSHYPSGHVGADVMDRWVADIKSRGKGKVKVEYQPYGALHSLKDALEAIQGAVTDIAPFTAAYYPGVFPVASVTDLPYCFSSPLQGYRVMRELWDKYFKVECEKKGLKMLVPQTNTPYHLLTAKKPVRKLEDMKGLKVRPLGKYGMAAVKLMGGVPVKVTTAEVYTALQRGMIDGAIWNIMPAYAFKVYEQVNYVTKLDLQCASFGCVMNLQRWSSMPKDVQEILLETGDKSAKDWASSFVKKAEWCEEQFKKTAELITLSPGEMARIKTLVEPLWNKWITDMEAKGIPARELVTDLRKLAKKYE